MIRHIFRQKIIFPTLFSPIKNELQFYSTKDIIKNEEAGKDIIKNEEACKKELLDKIHEEYDNIHEKIKELEPEAKTLKILKRDMHNFKILLKSWVDKSVNFYDIQICPVECDILIIGGGAIGSSIAYWLKQRLRNPQFKVVVIEKDPSYIQASSTLSVGGLRQQFSLEENIEMSLFGAHFIENVNEYLWVSGEPEVDLNFHPTGYLTLASEQGAQQLIDNSQLQTSMGAKNVILSKTRLNQYFPWLNTDGIEAGCLGLEKEGWFDPWSLLYGFKRKAINLGARFIKAEVKGFTFREIPGTIIAGVNDHNYKTLEGAVVLTPEGNYELIKCAICVIAAGAWSGQIADMAKIGRGEGVLSIPLPVEPRKRYAYCYHSPEGPGINTPLTIDPSGTYFRRDGLAGHYIAGRAPNLQDEPATDDLDVDHEYFNESIWPILANRVKGFENLKVKSSWAGYYEYNTFDKNGIIGGHPYYFNLFFATGFSGHGIQQSPAVGRAIAEIILESKFLTIDLTRLGFDRFITREPMREMNVI